MPYQRVSPGVYRDTATGKVIKSTTDPNTAPAKGAQPAGKKPAGKPPIVSTQGPLGGSSAAVDKNGNVTYTDTLSPGNQGAVEGIQGNAAGASGALQGFLTGVGTPNSPTSGLENSIFSQLSGAGRSTGIDANFARDQAQLQQTLANRGIPVGSKLYNDQMAQLNDRHDVNLQDARNQATQTAWGQLPTLAGISQSGYIAPPNQVDPNAVFAALQQKGLSEDQIKAQIQIAQMNNARRGGGGSGGGGGSAASAPNAFYNTAPPGAA